MGGVFGENVLCERADATYEKGIDPSREHFMSGARMTRKWWRRDELYRDDATRRARSKANALERSRKAQRVDNKKEPRSQTDYFFIRFEFGKWGKGLRGAMLKASPAAGALGAAHVPDTGGREGGSHGGHLYLCGDWGFVRGLVGCRGK